MPRNLYDRVEVLFPLKDNLLRERVKYEILDSYLGDNMKSRIGQKDGSYVRPWQLKTGKRQSPPTGNAAFNAQQFFIALAEGKQSPEAIPMPKQSKQAAQRKRVLQKEN